MSLKREYEEKTKWRREHDPLYQFEELCLAVTDAIQERMRAEGVSKAELARRLGVSPAQISKLLNAATCNLTLRTLARVAHALDARLEWDFRRLLPEVWYWECESHAVDGSADTLDDKAQLDVQLAAA
jgi:transcriptional regulator with XRE-family HTH domain